VSARIEKAKLPKLYSTDYSLGEMNEGKISENIGFKKSLYMTIL
jgi:hypothetical protein